MKHTLRALIPALACALTAGGAFADAATTAFATAMLAAPPSIWHTPHLRYSSVAGYIGSMDSEMLGEGKIVGGAKILSDGAVQGWWIPKYIADANPEIKTIDDVFKHPELFPDPEDASKGAVHNGPQGWGGTVITAQLYKAYGGEAAGFTLVDTGSSAGLDGSIANAYEKKEGWVGYYWAPTALLGKYEMVKVEHGADLDMDEWKSCTSNADCAEPKKNDWPTDTVQTLVAKPFADAAPAEVMDYLNKRAWTNATVNGIMAWMTDNQATGEDGARQFLKENEALWMEWVSPEVAEKVKAAL